MGALSFAQTSPVNAPLCNLYHQQKAVSSFAVTLCGCNFGDYLG